MTSIAVFVLLLAASLFLSAACSSTETASFQIGPSDVRALEGRRRVHRALLWVVTHRRRTLVTVLLLNLVINLFYMNVGQALAHSAGVRFGPEGRIAVDVAVLLLLLTLGEVLPKIFAMRKPRAIASLTAVPLYLAEKVLALPRIALTAVSDALMRLLGVEEEEGDVTASELQEVLKVAATKGQLGMDEHEWLRALLDLDQVHVKEIMVPRVEITAFDLRGGRQAFLDLFVRTRRNKIPVHEGNVDKITGYLNAKDLLTSPDKPLAELVRKVIFIPESASIAAAMQQMQKGGRKLAIVVDEYGGTEGLVTQEDLVESVVGDLSDESEDRWEPVREESPGVFIVDAALPIHALRRLFGHAPLHRGIATVGGLVSASLERVPKKGDRIAVGRVSIEVAAMRGKRPDRLIVRYDRTSTRKP